MMKSYIFRLSFPGRLSQSEELSFAIEEFVVSFSSPGWVGRMHQASDLEATFRQLLAAVDLIRPPSGRKLDIKLVRCHLYITGRGFYPFVARCKLHHRFAIPGGECS